MIIAAAESSHLPGVLDGLEPTSTTSAAWARMPPVPWWAVRLKGFSERELAPLATGRAEGQQRVYGLVARNV